jgi:NitT/TauT family transport system substrate-binding protein
LIVLTVFVLTLSACEETKTLEVIVPNGAPALSQIEVEHSMRDLENPAYDVEVVYGPDPLVSAFGSESHDIIIAPTNLGAKLYTQADAPYQFAGTITWGNLYLASNDALKTLDDLEGKTITAFGENTTPDIVLRAVLDAYDFEEAPDIEYVDGVDTAIANLSESETSVALVAEPALSAFEMKTESMNTVDLQGEWETHVSDKPYPQAGVFVHTDLSEDAIDTYLDALKESMEMVNQDSARVGEMMESLDYPFPAALMPSVIPRSNIEFKSASDSRDSVIAYFEVIGSFNPALYGASLPDDGFYYDYES